MPRKMRSIKTKLIGSIVSIVIVMIIVLVTFSYGKSANVIEEYSKELLSSSVGNQTAQIEAWLKENISSFQMVKTTIETMKFDDLQLQEIIDSFYNYNSNYPEGIYIGDGTGKLWKAKDASISTNNINEEIWYKEGLTRVNMAVGSPYINSAGEKVISVSGILNDGKNRKTVISADMALDRISIIVNSFIEMKHAEAFLVDKTNNVILAHRDTSVISKKLDEQTDNIFFQKVAEKITVQDYDFCTIEDNMTVFEEVSGTNWAVSYTHLYYAIMGENEKAIKRLERYAKTVTDLLHCGRLHGDSYFTKLNHWFEQLDLGPQMPRSKKLILENARENLKNPIFAGLKQMKDSLAIERILEEI